MKRISLKCKSRRINWTSPVTVSFLLVGQLLFGCGESSDSNANRSVSSGKVTSEVTQRSDSSAVARWPRARGDDASIDVASNLTAKNYYVVLDGSGSMKQRACSGAVTKEVASKEALSEFSSAISESANLGLIVFDSIGVSERVSLVGGKRETFLRQVNAMRAGGETPLRSVIEAAGLKLEEQARRQLGYGEYHLVIVTDGEASSGQNPTQIVEQLLFDTPIVIHTIGFCIGNRHSLNQPGRTIYKSANNPDELKQGLEDVLAEAETFKVTQFAG